MTGALTLCMLGNFACFFVVCNFFFKINFFKKIFQEYHQSVKKFVSRSGPTMSGLICVQTVGKSESLDRSVSLRGLGRLSSILYKGDNFCDFLFAFLHTMPGLKKVYSKMKEFARKFGRKFSVFSF